MIVQARQKTSAQLLRKAIEEAEGLKKKILAEAKVKAEKLKKDIVGKGEAEAWKINEEAEVEKRQIIKKAEENFKQAVEKTAIALLTIIGHRKR
jgi:vacuolar-type H+-ATPase subunit H